jgi:hypothetical protein
MRNNGITERIISANQVIVCLAIILIHSLWNKYSSIFYKWFKVLLLIEGLLYSVLMYGMAMKIFSPFTYYLTDTLIFSFITNNIICGANKITSIRYKGESREKYDNTISIAAAAATLIGSSVAIIIKIPTSIAFILSWVGIIIDNIFYWIVYNKQKAIIQ